MPLLLIDGTPIIANAKGVGRYAHQLCLQIFDRLPANWTVQVLIAPGAMSLLSPDSRGELVPVPPASEIRSALAVMPAQLMRLKPDLFLKTNESAALLGNVPTVVICHDVDQLIDKAQGSQWSPARLAINATKRFLRRRTLQAARVVVCNSEFTRGAIRTHYGIPLSRSDVAYCAVDPRFYEYSAATVPDVVRQKYGVARFVLTFATGDPRENFSRLPEVAEAMADLGADTCLLVAGVRRQKPYAAQLRQEFLRRGLIEGRQFQFEEFLGADRFRDLAELYAAADFYLDLSLHEGFGMQLVEAMACGTTCISSPAGALREIGNGYVVFVDPANPGAIASAIAGAYRDNLNARNNEDQVAYTRKFSWDNAGITVCRILQQVAEHGSVPLLEPGRGPRAH